MAKRSTMKRDRFINRYRGRIILGNPLTNPAVVSWQTGMNVGRSDPFKWVVTHFAIWPENVMRLIPRGANDVHQSIKAQLCIGQQSDLLEDFDMQVVTSASCQGWHNGDGADRQVYGPPLQGYLPSPIPVFAQTLSVVIKGLTTHAEIAGQYAVFEVGYINQPIAQDEIIEYLAAFGQV